MTELLHRGYPTSTAPDRIDVICPPCCTPGEPHSLVVENHYRLIRCTACGSQYFRPDPDLDTADGRANREYWEAYKFELYSSPVIQDAFAARYDRVLDEARKHIDPLTGILKIGCGIRNFVAHAQSIGLRAIASDVDAKAIEVARGRGAQRLHRRDGRDGADRLLGCGVALGRRGTPFDPTVILRQLVAKVRPDGAVLIERPDAAFPLRLMLLAAHRHSRRRFDFTEPMYYWEHKVDCTERGLRILLGRLGVDVGRTPAQVPVPQQVPKYRPEQRFLRILALGHHSARKFAGVSDSRFFSRMEVS